MIYDSKATCDILCEFIDNLQITGENYNILLHLVNDADDALFTKIIEEIYNNNLQISDFSEWLDMSDILSKNIEHQHELFEEIKKMKDFIPEYNVSVYNIVDGLPIQIEKKNILTSLLLPKDTDSAIDTIYKQRLLTQVMVDPSTIDNILLSANDFIVPGNVDRIILNDFDKRYAKENGLSEFEMKKLKAFSVFIAQYNGGDVDGN